MALITTPNAANADSYATLAEYTARAAAFGWTLADTDAANEVNLRRAAMTLDTSYAFRGIKETEAQSREWPRIHNIGYGSSLFFDPYPIRAGEVPTAVKDAQMELAFALQSGFDPVAAIEAPVKEIDSQAGSLRERIVYAGTQGNPRLPAVDRLLRNYISHGAGQARAVRG